MENTIAPATPVTQSDAAAPRPKRRLRTFGKWVLRVFVVILAVALAAQLTYMFSGSGEWESLSAKNGVQIFEKKVPGRNIKEYKAVFKVKSTLSRFVAFSTIEDSDMEIDYYDMQDLEKVSEQLIYSTWKQKFPSPFKPRHFVVKNEFTQDPATKVLVYTVQAANDRMPEDDCCVRVARMDNSWTLTPLGNGEIQVEWVSNLDMGGALPYFVLNGYQPGGMRFFATNLQRYLDQEKFANVKYAWIQEP